MRLTALILLASLCITVPQAHALKPFRCNGRIQYRPCGQTVSLPKPIPTPAGARFARVLTQKFDKVSDSEGVWHGRIEGNGTVQLELEILRNGHQESKRFMGAVTLTNKATSFKFRSSLPKGSEWTWKVSASVQS